MGIALFGVSGKLKSATLEAGKAVATLYSLIESLENTDAHFQLKRHTLHSVDIGSMIEMEQSKVAITGPLPTGGAHI